jgi:hypothetical protein
MLAATAQLQVAVSNMQDAQKHTIKAEFKVGRVRHIIRQSGYGSVLHKRRNRQSHVQTFNGMCF